MRIANDMLSRATNPLGTAGPLLTRNSLVTGTPVIIAPMMAIAIRERNAMPIHAPRQPQYTVAR